MVSKRLVCSSDREEFLPNIPSEGINTLGWENMYATSFAIEPTCFNITFFVNSIYQNVVNINSDIFLNIYLDSLGLTYVKSGCQNSLEPNVFHVFGA